MFKNNSLKQTLDSYQAPQVSVITLQSEQTILSISPGGIAPVFGGFKDDETPLD